MAAVVILLFSFLAIVPVSICDSKEHHSCGERGSFGSEEEQWNCPRMASTLDFETKASVILTENARNYYASGATMEHTLKDNLKAFLRHRIVPRMMTRVANRSLCTSILGNSISMPIAVAPSAFHKLANSEGEIGTAKAVQEAGTLMILSTMSTITLEEVAASAPQAPKWMQLYVFKNRTLTKEIVQRAEAAGYSALVLTCDGANLGIRYADERNKFELPKGMEAANLRGLKFGDSKGSSSVLAEFFRQELDPTVTWEDLAWLKTITNLPIVAKGILTGRDALGAIENGAAAIYVSNHGGRQLDGVKASLDALADVVKAVDGKREVYMDGGIRVGSDVLKALALGAKAVFIGRPNLWGLTYSGSVGSKCILDKLRNELDNAMMLSGVSNVNDVPSDIVVKESSYM